MSTTTPDPRDRSPQPGKEQGEPAGFRVPAGDPSLPLERVWPPFGLRLESPRLVLRLLRDADLPAYLAATTEPIAHTRSNPFSSPWNEGTPEQKAHASFAWLWECRSRMDQADLMLLFGVFLKTDAGEVLIGMQDVGARDFTLLHQVSTASWLVRAHQGKGLGREMREAVLLWAFDHLGAQAASSGAYAWNDASRAVSEKLGYRPNGTHLVPDAHGRQAEEEVRYRVAAEEFVRPTWDLRVTGHREFAAYIGID